MKNKINKKSVLTIIGVILTYVIIYGLTKTKVINSYYAGIINLALINIMLAVSLNLIVGFTGQLCLGHAGFMSIGAYLSAILTQKAEIPFIVSIFIGAIIACIISALIGYPTLRLTGDYFAITTLAFCEIIRIVIMNIDFIGGARGLTGIPKKTNFTIAFIFAVITIVIIYNIIHSSQGRAMLSVRENEIAAESMGINAFKYKIMAFVIGAFFAGLAGGLYAHYMGYIQPTAFDFNKSIDYLTFVVFGGMGSLSGSVIATIILTFLPELLRGFQNFRMILYPLALIMLMIFRPQGLLGDKEITFKIFKLDKLKKNSDIENGKEA
ncbi:branched-chain amino acid ABC transporter permease [Clostridium neonatale]|uniref:branched-chain amino acid ABC transporter permease n=1 Tax=Clostridium neonatale TaxID=137838 RepID=UPI00291BF932|nr:High-affinity branched-chain amino acid ABC transporter, permease component (LIV-I protein M) [Clostridium neonatale]CAI3587619.1 High-affinity branched-chain amino acid ABC transporter, permease component (LIV-I protein M) [Clostridium neonatale]CAI3589040.1 High-affinity branched-chain amino acid ABC transporter, permease component (LIV-I protein M) [Clostridium neonatale]CAI3598392.1 High-affinity branched-chain amino acid ABC transporter, permease component (LIV-I protein M) [Clostridium 